MARSVRLRYHSTSSIVGARASRLAKLGPFEVLVRKCLVSPLNRSLKRGALRNSVAEPHLSPFQRNWSGRTVTSCRSRNIRYGFVACARHRCSVSKDSKRRRSLSMPGHFSGPDYASITARGCRFEIHRVLERQRENSAVCSFGKNRNDPQRKDDQRRARHVDWTCRSDATNRGIRATPLP